MTLKLPIRDSRNGLLPIKSLGHLGSFTDDDLDDLRDRNMFRNYATDRSDDDDDVSATTLGSGESYYDDGDGDGDDMSDEHSTTSSGSESSYSLPVLLERKTYYDQYAARARLRRIAKKQYSGSIRIVYDCDYLAADILDLLLQFVL